MSDRGTSIPVGQWWLALARRLVETDPRDLTTLGKDLAKRIHRTEPFSHSLLSRFAKGETGATDELAAALCTEYTRLPPAVFFPKSYEEAVHLQTVAERYPTSAREHAAEAPIVPMPEKPRRRRRRAGAATDDPVTAVATQRRRSR
jgi:hypothetical protein